MPNTTRTAPWTASEILVKLENDQKWLERGILVIYARQTSDEQAEGSTRHENGRGFTGSDAAFLSSLAQWIERGRRPLGQRLTPKQVEHARKRMRKYAGQLAKVANEKLAAEADAAREAFYRAQPNVGCAPDHSVECPECLGMSADPQLNVNDAPCATCRNTGRVGEMSIINFRNA